MTAPDAPSPYRHDLDAAFERIADLEAQLAGHRRAAPAGAEHHDPAVRRALGALRVQHLREDRAALIARHNSVRRGALAVTCVAMVGAFAVFFREARLEPANALFLWSLCGAVVTALAAAGLLAQTVVRGRDLRRLRALDRRVAEERVLAGLGAGESPREAYSAPDDARVRVAFADPLAAGHAAEPDPLDAAGSVQAFSRR